MVSEENENDYFLFPLVNFKHPGQLVNATFILFFSFKPCDPETTPFLFQDWRQNGNGSVRSLNSDELVPLPYEI